MKQENDQLPENENFEQFDVVQDEQLALLEQSLIELREVFRNHQKYIKDHFKISELEMEIVQYVARNGRKKMKDIGEAFNIKLSTLTSIVDKIERQKFVKRVNSKTDRRAVYLDLTPKGKNLYSKYSHYISVMAKLMKRRIADEHFDVFVSELANITKNFSTL
ncbi:MAG: winged helix-turn-helix transcriptional regulator [Bacteroidia bacterium]|nr:winged helix-turn-helix transcriptional regulator [Bacteroidia bacterium]